MLPPACQDNKSENKPSIAIKRVQFIQPRPQVLPLASLPYQSTAAQAHLEGAVVDRGAVGGVAGASRANTDLKASPRVETHIDPRSVCTLRAVRGAAAGPHCGCCWADLHGPACESDRAPAASSHSQHGEAVVRSRG